MFVAILFMAFVYKHAKFKRSYMYIPIRYLIQKGVVLLYMCTLNSLSPSILCSGRYVQVHVLVVSSGVCGLQTVTLALSHFGYRTCIKAIELLMV